MMEANRVPEDMMNTTSVHQNTTLAQATTSQADCVQIGLNPISDFLMGVYILAFVFGLTVNMLTLYPILHQVKQQNILGIFLLSLSVSDLLFIFTMPLWINYYNQDHKWNLGAMSCKVAGFFYYSNMYVSIYLLCCISVDRCLVVCYPLRFKSHRTHRYAWVLCAIVYVTVMVLHVIILSFGKSVDETSGRCYETYPMEKTVAIFNMVRVGLGFMLPLLVLAVSYWKVLATVGRSPSLKTQVKKKVRLLSFGVIGIFSICFAPYHIILFIRSLVFFSNDNHSPEGPYCKFEQNIHFFFSVTLALSSLNSMVDPVLYVLVSNGVKDKMSKCWGRTKHTVSNESSQGVFRRESPNDKGLI
uniref:G protein-coupled receptor 132 n=1 Tax=Nothobranchius kadleci TaxID=1051664 RepID=A0A1A8E3V8_NOTKA